MWFKVQEEGRQGTSSTWAANALMVAGGSVNYTIPACLAAGYYLVRHEIIALHSASTYPGAQFYPGCHQLKVTGSGTTKPSSGLVSFPGSYKASDPGVTYNAYVGMSFPPCVVCLLRSNSLICVCVAQTYTIPGPKKFTC